MCTPCEEKRKAMKAEMEARQQLRLEAQITKVTTRDIETKQPQKEVGCNAGNPWAVCASCNILCKYCKCV